MDEIIIGKRTILFPLAKADFEQFIQLHRADKNGYLLKFCLKEMSDAQASNYVIALIMTGQIKVWTVVTKEGKASRRAGYVYISDISKSACNINGIMDKEFSRGLAKQLKKGKNTFSQDALHTMLGYCFLKLDFNRVASDCLSKNRLAQSLLKKEKFIKEGVMRQGIDIDGTFHDIVTFSILHNEYKDMDLKMLRNEQIASIVEDKNVKQKTSLS